MINLLRRYEKSGEHEKKSLIQEGKVKEKKTFAAMMKRMNEEAIVILDTEEGTSKGGELLHRRKPCFRWVED